MDEFQIQIALDSGFSNIVEDLTTNANSIEVTLTGGQTYYWRVRQYYDSISSYGDWSDVVSFTVQSNLSTPVFDTASFTNDLDSVSAVWDTVTEATGYNVRLNGGTPIDVGNVMGYIFENLSQEIEHTIEVQAYNSTDVSDWAAEVVQTDVFVPSGDESTTGQFQTASA